MKKINLLKKVSIAILSLSVCSAFAGKPKPNAKESEEMQPDIRSFEIEIPLNTKCYPTQMLKDHLKKHEIVMASEDTTKDNHVLIDFLIYVPSKKGLFLIRENRELSYTCVISFFDKEENKKPNKKTSILYETTIFE